MHRLRNFALSALAVIVLAPAAAHATAINAVGSFTVANSGQTPGSATDYALFGWQGSPSSVLTDFTVTTYGAIFNGGSSYNYGKLIAPGGSVAYYTGIDYNATHAASFTSLSGGDFIVYVLDGNSDGNSLGNTSVGLSVNGGSEVTIASSYPAYTNEFSEFSVTGASAGDQFQIYANSNTRPSIGGVSFGPSSASPVPEPGSFALLGTGLLGALGAARRRIRA